MSLRFSGHSKIELLRRQLCEDRVLKVAKDPEQVVPARNGLECRQSRFIDESSGKTYLLRIIVNPKVTPKLIVTVYKTSKVEKYWEA